MAKLLILDQSFLVRVQVSQLTQTPASDVGVFDSRTILLPLSALHGPEPVILGYNGPLCLKEDHYEYFQPLAP